MDVFSFQKQSASVGPIAGTLLAVGVVLLVSLISPRSYSQQLTFGGIEVEEQVEEQVEDSVEDALSEDTEAVVDDAVDDEVGDQVVDAAEDAIDDQLTFGGIGVDEQVDDQVTEQVEDALADEAEDSADLEIADQVEEATEQQVVDVTEEVVEDTLTAELEADIEETVVEEAEEDVVAAVEETAASEIEDQVADASESAAVDQVDAAAQEAVEDVVAEATAEQVGDDVEDATEEAVTSAVVATSESDVEEVVINQLDDNASAAIEVALVTTSEQRLEAEIDEMLDDIESEIDVDERRIHRGQWLVMAEPKVFDELLDEGYIFDEFTDLPSLGLRLAEVAAPASFDISAAREGVLDVVGSDRAQVDLNHIYTAGTPDTVSYEQGVAPRDALAFPDDTDSLEMRIGIIDSAVDVSHPAFVNARIQQQVFASSSEDLPDFHGTAIASIFAADGGEMRGLAPSAELFAASVFERDAEQGEVASTVSLVRALDWLLASDVDTINVSLAGPPNRLLEVALKRVAARGVMVMAAAGNGGPMARPKYPAAYETVVAVTAVDGRNRVFRLANRGGYLDLAAPGVNLRHAAPGGGYIASSGTSFAVPFATTAAARLKRREPGTDVLARLYSAATDLGPPGRDDIYGYGLLVPQN